MCCPLGVRVGRRVAVGSGCDGNPDASSPNTAQQRASCVFAAGAGAGVGGDSSSIWEVTGKDIKLPPQRALGAMSQTQR